MLVFNTLGLRVLLSDILFMWLVWSIDVHVKLDVLVFLASNEERDELEQSGACEHHHAYKNESTKRPNHDPVQKLHGLIFSSPTVVVKVSRVVRIHNLSWMHYFIKSLV